MITCIKCKYEWDEEIKYCKNCGTLLQNHCSNPDCECNDTDEPIYFNFDDCFCSECGSKTTYYVDGLIDPQLD